MARGSRVASPAIGIRLDIGDAVEHPARIIGLRQQRGIADRGPQQTPERVVEAGDRIPCGLRSFVDAQREPAVPGKILELDRAQKHRRIESRDGIEADVLDALGQFPAEILPPYGLAAADLSAMPRQHKTETWRRGT